MMNSIKKYLYPRLCLLVVFLFMLGGYVHKEVLDEEPSTRIEHEVAYFEEGKFAAWPANGGMWIWGNEILVCFTVADHDYNVNSGHTYDVSTSRNMLARSLDSVETWNIEDAYEQGITGKAMDHQIGSRALKPKELENPIDFQNPNFALLFQRETNRNGPTHFYYTYDRGKSWFGPYTFPNLDPAGITNRTDYFVDSKNELSTMLSIGHGRTAIARTDDGGLSWDLISYVGPDFTKSEEISGRNDYSLMPSTVRLSNSKILTTIRHREGDGGKVWITSYLSGDNGLSWTKLEDPVKKHVNSPPALVKLPDGRLVLIYIERKRNWEVDSIESSSSVLAAKISNDEGHTWGKEIILRENDGANSDVGYPKAVVKPDGEVVIAYYWNHSLDENEDPYRYIAITSWTP
ncbi:exo-alpha-sialidase [Rhodohalobacter sulfatireducens]|uniref:Exo-alpha-sialidase n=1 Tax=Rhodohalobacter sulfatireducens TaxID=2911366 RepID=A0ABS9KAB6_9BACT|nr:exo-alpha-sialidase [Rhodohalobacter sulfatireducens]MCG2587802.1 exo-alpha-sialidase [Rhodohalobacter sulfatireducens]